MGKKITICFDGTCNHPEDARQEREWFGLGEIEDNSITNVLKLHILFGGNLINSVRDAEQCCLYYSGIGTYGNRFQKMFNVMFAPENLDVDRILSKACDDLTAIWQEGDTLYLFGFSRGAALARRFAALLLHKGLDDVKNIPSIRFLAVFDTVASLGLPNFDDDEKPVSDVVFENNTVAANVEEALHLVSLDENRIAFQPTLMNKCKRVTEIWFPGGHSDVGGGFWHDGLSDIALDFLVKEMEKRNLGLKIKRPEEIEYDNLMIEEGAYPIDLADLKIEPTPLGEMHLKDRWFPVAGATLAKRLVRVNHNDRVSKDLPVLHHSIVERIQQDSGYRPENLLVTPHRVLWKDYCCTTHQNLNDHLPRGE